MTGAQREPKDVTDDLASGDPERIRIGLAGLREIAKAGDEFELPALDPSLLRPFGESPPEDTVLDLARLLADYRSFVPHPSRAYRIRQLVELAVRYPVPSVVHETSVEIQRQDDPESAARNAVGYLRARGLQTRRELEAAQTLIGYLLEAKSPLRLATAEALAAWSATDTKRAIVAAVLPLIDPDQRAVLESPPDPARTTLPRMRFRNVAVNRQQRYALGIEQNSDTYYITIPVSNGIIEYGEYYEIDKHMFERYSADLDSALPFVIRCRNRFEDPRLMYQPSIRRGTPV
jgi:hypothetical protein